MRSFHQVGAVPPAAISDWRYLVAALCAGLITFWSAPLIERLKNPVRMFDAAGLALLAVAGAESARVRAEPSDGGSARHAHRHWWGGRSFRCRSGGYRCHAWASVCSDYGCRSDSLLCPPDAGGAPRVAAASRGRPSLRKGGRVRNPMLNAHTSLSNIQL